MRQVEAISYLLGLDATPNGYHYNWFAQTHSGPHLSLYYETNREPIDLNWVEVCDTKKVLGLPTDQDGIVMVEIKDLPKYFKQKV